MYKKLDGVVKIMCHLGRWSCEERRLGRAVNIIRGIWLGRAVKIIRGIWVGGVVKLV